MRARMDAGARYGGGEKAQRQRSGSAAAAQRQRKPRQTAADGRRQTRTETPRLSARREMMSTRASLHAGLLARAVPSQIRELAETLADLLTHLTTHNCGP